MYRRLTLKAEHLTELTANDLASVAGGSPTADCPTTNCFTGYYPTINAPCTTLLRPVTTVIGETD